MRRLKIVSLHCFGSNARKHAGQRWHFTHCAQACAGLADFVYTQAPLPVDEAVVRSLLRDDMGCTDDEVAAFGFKDPRCWYRFTGGRYIGLEARMDALAEWCARERPDGIAGYSNGDGAALLVAAACTAGHDAFASIRSMLSFAGPTSPTLERYLREGLGPRRIAMPALVFGSRRDPMLARADELATTMFEHCELAIVDEARPFANHALPDDPAAYAPVVDFLARQRTG